MQAQGLNQLDEALQGHPRHWAMPHLTQRVLGHVHMQSRLHACQTAAPAAGKQLLPCPPPCCSWPAGAGSGGQWGSAALAAHEAKMHAWCRDVCKLVTDQVKLLRRTRQSIVGDDVDAWALMPLAAKDRALAAELKTEGSLHAALWPHNQHTCRGHYAVRPAALDSEARRLGTESPQAGGAIEGPALSSIRACCAWPSRSQELLVRLLPARSCV